MFKLERTARLSVWARAPVYYIAWAKPVSLYFLKGKKFQKLNAANMFVRLILRIEWNCSTRNLWPITIFKSCTLKRSQLQKGHRKVWKSGGASIIWWAQLVEIGLTDLPKSGHPRTPEDDTLVQSQQNLMNPQKKGIDVHNRLNFPRDGHWLYSWNSVNWVAKSWNNMTPALKLKSCYPLSWLVWQ